MATKAALDPKKLAAMTEAREALRSIPKGDLPFQPLSVGAVATLLDADPKTLYAARKTREESLEKKKAIHPLWLESIPFVETPGGAAYMALDVIEYMDLALGPTLHPSVQKLPQSYPGLKLPRTFLGFQAWMAEADATELWPFAMQPDGSPMDLIAAILYGRVGDEVRWLTIREFGEMAAHAAGLRRSTDEQTSIAVDTRIPDAPGEDEQEDRKDRWEKPGGPI